MMLWVSVCTYGRMAGSFSHGASSGSLPFGAAFSCSTLGSGWTTCSVMTWPPAVTECSTNICCGFQTVSLPTPYSAVGDPNTGGFDRSPEMVISAEYCTVLGGN